MRALLNLIRWMLLGLFRSKTSLEAEILALRHQLNVLRRASPRRPVFSNFPCGWEPVPDYLVRDRDRVYGEAFTRRIRAMGIRDRPTAPRSPWQNGCAERLIGSIRCECLDHVLVL